MTPPHGRTQCIRNQCNFLSKLVIVALSPQEWKSMPLAEGTCCSVEQWNDSGEWVALGPALKGPVNRTSFERDTTQVQGFPASEALKVNRGDASADMRCHLPYFWLIQIFFTPSLFSLWAAFNPISCLPAPDTDGYNFHEVMYPVRGSWDASYFSDCLLSQTDPLLFSPFYLHWDSLTKCTKNQKITASR